MQTILFVLLTTFAFQLNAQQLENPYYEHLQKLHEKGKFNGTALVIKNDSVILKRAYGVIDKDSSALLQTNTMFRIASLSKAFTAVAIMQQKEQSKLHLDQTIDEILSDFPYKGITIKQLLTHTSGLPDYLKWMWRNWKPELKYWDKNRYITNGDSLFNVFINRGKPLLFKPGKKWKYSNTGYHILVQILEKTSGLSYKDYIQKNILVPLGMNSTKFDDPADICCNYETAKRAYGYLKINKNKSVQNENHFINPFASSESILSNLDDLSKWNTGLRTNKLLSDPSIQEITYPHIKMNRFSKSYYGYGWAVVKTKWNTQINHHSGDWLGFKTYIMRDINQKDCIVLLTNNSLSNIGLSMIGYKLTEMLNKN